MPTWVSGIPGRIGTTTTFGWNSARLTMLWASRKPMGLTELPAQAMSVTPHHRVAWLLGREHIDGLSAAGIMG